MKRATDRRQLRVEFLAFTFLLLSAFGDSGHAAKQTKPPPPQDLQSGDLLWPKKPNSVIPYNASSSQAGPSDEAVWVEERDRYLAGLKAKPVLWADDQERRELLGAMSYRKFLAVFGEGEAPRGPSPHGGLLGVGHTAIVRVKDAKVTIVEAIWGIGVREVTYAEWVEQRRRD